MTVTIQMTIQKSNRESQQFHPWRAAAELAAVVRAGSAPFPAEDHDWLTDPLRHAAESAVDHLAEAWQRRADPAAFAALSARAEADVHEVQTWALLALRHGHWSHRVADDIDRRCETLLDALHGPAAVRRAA